MSIKRTTYETLFWNLASYFPVIGIIGPRQVGKTTFIKMQQNKFERETVYLDLELSTDLAKIEDPEFYLSQQIDKTVIIDEVQRKPELFPLLRALVDQNRFPVRFVLLGSASPELIRDSSESLSGRIAYLEVKPFSLMELTADKSQNDLWLRGGFPPALLAPSKSTADLWMRNFIKTYIERDLPLLGLRAAPLQLERMWRMLAHLNGRLLNTVDVGRSLGISHHTAKRYIDFLENAFLITTIQPFFSNLKKRLIKAPKIFIADTGILHYLHNIEDIDALFAHPAVGLSWEAFVVQQIKACKPEQIDMYFYRTHNGAEVDIVLTKGIVPVATVEAKFTNAPKLTRGATAAIQDINAPMNYVITPSSDNYLMKEHIRVCSLARFVQEYLPAL